jgi:hypothetical protein
MNKMSVFLSLLSVSSSRLPQSVAWSVPKRVLSSVTALQCTTTSRTGSDMHMHCSDGRKSSSMKKKQQLQLPHQQPLLSSRQRTTRTGRHGWHRTRSSSSAALLLSSMMMMVGGFSTLTYCSAEEEQEEAMLKVPPFDESSFTFDHYNGVTLHLDKLANTYPTARIDSSSGENVNPACSFETDLKQALLFWKAQGRRGIWINVPPNMSHLVPVSDKNDSRNGLHLFFEPTGMLND